ncbi:MAG: sulfite exporter TauE/SafE family protein [Clostridiales bacterium]|nr:sulfite exporter TauE/SafE family protein [Clostridiales bacterium]
MWDKLILVALGALVGVLSGMGVGGGSLLIVLLSAFMQVEQPVAQGINLLYFLPTAAVAVGIHLKKGNIEKKTAAYGSAAGLLTALAGSLLAGRLEAALLKKLFAGLIFAAGLSELFSKDRPKRETP